MKVKLNDVVFLRRIVDANRGQLDCVVQGLVVGVTTRDILSMTDGSVFTSVLYTVRIDRYGDVELPAGALYQTANEAFV